LQRGWGDSPSSFFLTEYLVVAKTVARLTETVIHSLNAIAIYLQRTADGPISKVFQHFSLGTALAHSIAKKSRSDG
jgi:hypothetical protein